MSPGGMMAAGANGPMKYVGLTEIQGLRQTLYRKPIPDRTYFQRC